MAEISTKRAYGVYEKLRNLQFGGSQGSKRFKDAVAETQDVFGKPVSEIKSCVVATGTEEIKNRILEIKIAFGTNLVDHFCQQVQDYVGVLLDRERNRLSYKGSSPQLAARSSLVRLMMKISEGENLTRATLHLAVYVYDRFADFHDIPVTQLTLTAATCLMIAGKVEEKDTRIPKMKRLRSYLLPAPNFCFKAYTDIEYYIIKYFQWSFLVPNSYTFLEYFLLFVVDATERLELTDSGPSDEAERNNNVYRQPSQCHCTTEDGCLSPHSIKSMKTFAVEVADTLLFEEPNDAYPPSLVAAAIVMFARRAHGLHTWPHQLVYVTSYRSHEVLTCCDEHIHKLYERQSKCNCLRNVPSLARSIDVLV